MKGQGEFADSHYSGEGKTEAGVMKNILLHPPLHKLPEGERQACGTGIQSITEDEEWLRNKVIATTVNDRFHKRGREVVPLCKSSG